MTKRKKRSAPKRKSKKRSTPPDQDQAEPLPVYEIRAARPSDESDGPTEQLARIIDELLNIAIPAWCAAARIKSHMVELLEAAPPGPPGRPIVFPATMAPNTSFAVEESALRADYERRFRARAEQLPTPAQRQEAHRCLDVFFAKEASEAVHLLEQTTELAKAAAPRCAPATTRSLLRDLERVKSFLLPDEHAYDETLEDAIASLRARRRELLEEQLGGGIPAPDDPAGMMPASWFKTEFGIHRDRLRSAHRRGSLRGEKRDGRWFYSVPDARRLWPEDIIDPEKLPG